MRKTGSKKPKIKHGKDQDLLLEKGLDRLTEELVEVAEEIDSVTIEGSSLEDIEGAKALAADVLEKYYSLMNRLGQRDKMQLQQSIGPLAERIRKGLILLKEAPE
jgi:NTP pyrophosphatase (non-canonical NTP hydrolase)